ncbi:hypothetical protein [Coraliomargarita parva]|uniref:hypothetical protein n=1 Tax=Coraliomargarita parva TaxID=3014050 RepID=UPI0022B2E1E1|nr:hypothetical protein [Coraliomargarita parva]
MNDKDEMTPSLNHRLEASSQILGVLVVAFLITSNLRLWNVMWNGGQFALTFDDMLEGSRELPFLARIFTIHHNLIYGILTALAIAAISLILVRKQKPACLGVGIVVALFSCGVAEIANYCYWQVFHEFLRQLT